MSGFPETVYKTKRAGRSETVVTCWLYFLVTDVSCAQCPENQFCTGVARSERLWSVFTSAFPATDESEPLLDTALPRPAQPAFPVTPIVFLCFLPSLIYRSWLSLNEVLDLLELFSKGAVNKTGLNEAE